MLATLLLAAGVGLYAPGLVEELTPGDYPVWAMREDRSGGGVYHVVIDPKGKIVSCSLVVEIGDPRLAKSVCAIVARKRHRPAQLRDGRKVHTVLDTMVNLHLPDTKEGRRIGAMRPSPDAELSVSQLPIGGQLEVSVLLAFDAAGKITDCASPQTAKSLTLANLACNHRAIFDNAIQKDNAGIAVPYVTRKRIRFVQTQPAK